MSRSQNGQSPGHFG